MRWCPKRMTHKRIQKWLPINLRIFQVTISPLIWQKYTKGEKGRVYSIVQPTVPLQKVEVPPWKNTFFWNEKSQRKVNLISAWIAWIKMIGENIGGKWPTITPEQLLHPLRIFALQMERRKIAQYLFLVGRDDKWHIRSSVWAKNLVGDFLTCATHELKKL